MSALGLNITKLAGPGRLAKPLESSYVRDIEEADLALMSIQPLGSVSTPLKRITDRHHSLARLLSAGTTDGEAALITGYDISRVSILKNSPAFQELLSLYQSEVKREFVSNLEHMAGVSRDAILVLRERLEDDDSRFSNNELMKIGTEFSDRTENNGVNIPDLPDVIELVAPEVLEREDGDLVPSDDILQVAAE